MAEWLPAPHGTHAAMLVAAGSALKRPASQFLQPTLSTRRVASLHRPAGHSLHGTLAPAEVARLRAAQLDAQRRSAVEHERGDAWWRERFAPGNPARLAGIDA